MALGRELLYIIRAKDDASKTFQKVRGDVEALNLSAGKAGKTLDLAFSQLNVETGRQVRDFGLTLLNAVGSFAEAGRESVQVGKQLDAVLRSTKGAAGLTRTELDGMATALANVTDFEDEAIQSGQVMLLRFTEIGKEVFPQATQAMANMAASGIDMSTAALQLGKALNDPIGGLDALSRSGIQFTDQQRAMIEQMVKAGDTAGAQRLILGELETKYGGLAQASANASTQFTKSLNDIKEEIGKSLIPAIDGLAQAVTPVLQKISQWIADNPELARTIGLIVAAVGVMLTVFGTLVVVIGSVAAALAVIGVTLALGGALALAIAGITALVVALAYHWEALKTMAVDAVQTISDRITSFAVTVGEKFGLAEESIKSFMKTLKEAASAAANLTLNTISAAVPGANLVRSAVGRAGGGRTNEPFTLVGERGPELVSLPRGSMVHPADETERLLSGEKTVTQHTINMGPFYISKEVDADSVIDRLTRLIQLQTLQAS